MPSGALHLGNPGFIQDEAGGESADDGGEFDVLGRHVDTKRAKPLQSVTFRLPTEVAAGRNTE